MKEDKMGAFYLEEVGEAPIGWARPHRLDEMTLVEKERVGPTKFLKLYALKRRGASYPMTIL